MPLLSDESCETWPPSVHQFPPAPAALASPATPMALPTMFSGTLIGATSWVPFRMPLLSDESCVTSACAAPGANSRAPAARTPTLRVLRTQDFMEENAFRKMSAEWWCTYSVHGCFSGAAVPWRVFSGPDYRLSTCAHGGWRSRCAVLW